MVATDLDSEIEYRRAIGCAVVSVAEMERRFLALGYRLDRRMDCRSVARHMTGPHAGQSYPCVSTGVVEVDTRLSAWNVSARRDANFRAMQQLRQDVCAVTRGAILEV